MKVSRSYAFGPVSSLAGSSWLAGPAWPAGPFWLDGPPAVRPPGLAVENARNRSPEKCEPLVPVLARPIVTRRASALHWLGKRGASVATTAIMDPAPDGLADWSRIGLSSARRSPR